METVSINGKLSPSGSIEDITNQYAGFYVNVSYRHTLGTHTVYSKDRVEVEDGGKFRFYAPEPDNLSDGTIELQVKTPSGETIYKRKASIHVFFPASTQQGEEDVSEPFEIIAEFPNEQGEAAIILPDNFKLKGRVIDSNGNAKTSSLQVVIWATESDDEELDQASDSYKPIFAGETDSNGYFYGRYPRGVYQKCVAVVAGATENPMPIELDKTNSDYHVFKLPVILIVDVAGLDIKTEDCSCDDNTPHLPDENALAESGTYSQDLGGHCVNFTTPNRVLEEFLYCYAVRTTEQEIKGVTLSPKDTRVIRNDLTTANHVIHREARLLRKSFASIMVEEFDGKTQEKIEAKKKEAVDAVLVDDVRINQNKSGAVAPVNRERGFSTGQVQHIESVGHQHMAALFVTTEAVQEQLSSLQKTLDELWEKIVTTKNGIEKIESEGSTALEELVKYRKLLANLKNHVAELLILLDEYLEFYKTHRVRLSLSDPYFVSNEDKVRFSLGRYVDDAEHKINEIERIYAMNHPGRREVSVDAPVDWDDEPTIYQNTTIGHGHLLCFKQQWKAAGYSLGDLLCSLPLAPCQKKQIAIFDWDREEVGSRSEIQTNAEHLTAQLIRNRTVDEMQTSSLSERSQGSSSSSGKTSGWSASASVSVPVGPALVGVSGGYSSSKTSAASSANQSSSRNLSANASNKLKDSVQQSAASVRSQRSTVIQTVGQGETFNVTTEVIANHNHCHSLTVQYFEVLRHFVVEQNLVEVAECLFVPLEMSMFDMDKAIRWKNNLRSYLLDRSLLPAFDSIERIHDNYQNSNLRHVNGAYADETIEGMFGELRISFEIPRPEDPVNDEDFNDASKKAAIETLVEDAWRPWTPFMRGLSGGGLGLYKARFMNRLETVRDKIFENEVVPKLVKNFVDQLEIKAIRSDGSYEDLNLDVTLISKYKRGIPLHVTIRPEGGQVANIPRSKIKQILIHSPADVPDTAKIILHSGSLRYRTLHLNEYLFRSRNLLNDIVHNDAATIYTPLNTRELVEPKKEDYRISNLLLEHLNEYLEHYHRQLWQFMDRSRLFNLLDGFIAPNSQGRSVSSVVENQVYGVVGNNLILKVAPGYNLDPTFRLDKGFDLLNHYQPVTPVDPYRISVPTKGVYAEAVMGACNSCEHIDESRHWRFSEVPCGDEPTAINPIDTGSRRADPGNLQSKNMEAPVVNIQNAPNAPDPTGLGAALDLMGKSDIFKDITGLDATQRNALQQMIQNSANLNKSGDLASHALDKAVELEKQKRAQQSSHTMRQNILEDFKDDPEKQKDYLEKMYSQQLGVGTDKEKSLLGSDVMMSKIQGSENLTYSGKEGTISIDGTKEVTKSEAIAILEELEGMSLNERVEALLNKLNDTDDTGYFLNKLDHYT